MRVFVFLAIILLVSSCIFLNSSQNKQLKKAVGVKPIDIAIVPGLPLYNGKWDTLLKTRILWAKFLYKRGYVSNILFSGNAVYTPWTEGPSMALYAEQLGIPKENIFIDTIAEHSTENLFYGYQLAKQKGFRTVCVSSDPFQCRFLKKFAKKNFEDTIYFLPVNYDSIRNEMKIELVIDSVATKKHNFIPIEKRLNYRQRMKGTRGKNISR